MNLNDNFVNRKEIDLDKLLEEFTCDDGFYQGLILIPCFYSDSASTSSASETETGQCLFFTGIFVPKTHTL